MELKIESMVCGGCARSVTKAIQLLDPAAKVEADPAARALKVETTASEAALLHALEEAGFPATAS